MALRVDEDDVLRFADAHDEVAGEISAAVQPDPALIASMTTGYGAVGAEFTAAVAEFQAAFLASGTEVSGRYQSHAGNLRAAAAGYVGTDAAGAAGIGSSGVI
jgi:hypothetical protein